MSDYLDPNNEELLKDFFVEASMQVDILEQNILAIEDNPEDRDAVDEIFRAAHTLKGGAATVQMFELSEFTHMVEDLLDAIREDQVKIDSNVVDTLLTAIDIIKIMLEYRQDGEIYQEDISSVKTELQNLLGKGGKKTEKAVNTPTIEAAPKAGKTEEPKSAKVKEKKEIPAQEEAEEAVLSEYEVLELREAAAGNETVYKVRVFFDEENPMNTVGGIQIFAKLKAFSKVLKTIPDFELLYEDNFFPSVDYYIATELDEKSIASKTETVDLTLDIQVSSLDKSGDSPEMDEVQDAIMPETVATSEEIVQQSLSSGDEEDNDAADIDESEEAKTEEGMIPGGAQRQKSKEKSAGSVLRVDSKRIDNLLNLVSEAVINKATFNQVSNKFAELQSDLLVTETQYKENIKNLFEEMPIYIEKIQAEEMSVKEVREELSAQYELLFSALDQFESRFKSTVGTFRNTAANLGRNTGDLHEAILRIRMVPISQIFSRFPRLVRDLSRSLEKKVDLIIEGEDTELDKSVIEELLDPLMHCVRNALDHGLEQGSDRLKKGKNETGRLLLKASNEGNMIIIEIADDGAGINVKAVKEKAIKKGIIHPGKTLSDVEAFNLIFEPGFSTAKEVTNLSGRGVGLDVVKKEIEKLNGSVSVFSKPDEGTRFTIKLPLTLAIIQGLLVRVGSETYAVPITSVIESLRIKPSEINIIDNYEVFNIRSDVISLLRLNKLFNIDTQEDREYNFVVIVGSGDKKMGLMVDSLIGEEDVVIKPLKDKYTNSPGIAGATILGDGTVSLIIDVSQLLDLGVQVEQRTRGAFAV